MADSLLLLIKYDSDGDLQWVRYASVEAWGLPSLDVDTRNVYVVFGNWLIKYDKMDGMVLDTYKLGEINEVIFDFVKVYGRNIYLAGQPTNELQIILERRDLDGRLLWRVDRESAVHEGARDIYLYRGMVYVTGIQGHVMIESDILSGTSDILLLKYDKRGNMVWERTWGTNSTLDWGFSAKVYRNKLYVIGLTSDNYLLNGTNTVLQKYDRDGDMEWSIVKDDVNRGVSVDVKDERIFMVGSYQNNIVIQQYIRKS